MGNNIIAVCDDEITIATKLQDIIETILGTECDWEIRMYSNGDDLLQDISNIRIVFLDIEMPKEDGIVVGKKIKEQNADCKIIMATGMPERFKEAFKIQAFRFVTKPFDDTEVREALYAAMESFIGQTIITAYCARNEHHIQERNIAYMEAYNGYSEIVSDNNRFRKDVALNELETVLDKRLFFRINRRYIVNVAYIDSYREGEIKIGKEKFSVSRRKRKEFEQKYIEFDLKYR